MSNTCVSLNTFGRPNYRTVICVDGKDIKFLNRDSPTELSIELEIGRREIVFFVEDTWKRTGRETKMASYVARAKSNTVIYEIKPGTNYKIDVDFGKIKEELDGPSLMVLPLIHYGLSVFGLSPFSKENPPVFDRSNRESFPIKLAQSIKIVA